MLARTPPRTWSGACGSPSSWRRRTSPSGALRSARAWTVQVASPRSWVSTLARALRQCWIVLASCRNGCCTIWALPVPQIWTSPHPSTVCWMPTTASKRPSPASSPCRCSPAPRAAISCAAPAAPRRVAFCTSRACCRTAACRSPSPAACPITSPRLGTAAGSCAAAARPPPSAALLAHWALHRCLRCRHPTTRTAARTASPDCRRLGWRQKQSTWVEPASPHGAGRRSR
mmetsp:Transcript_126907/g.406377  ORF Transcript_126907/g.406377 Transcript_126907/m.406377 type:complete len:230 (-) Transcript_126907:1156-1845(-)